MSVPISIKKLNTTFNLVNSRLQVSCPIFTAAAGAGWPERDDAQILPSKGLSGENRADAIAGATFDSLRGAWDELRWDRG
jgi:hypothetical protein